MARRPLPSLKALQAFEAFARLGSMTAAAEALFVTHGAVSRQIKALEAQLGAPLIAGPRHRLALTPAGRALAGALGSAFDVIAAALPGAERRQELVVSCLGTLAMKWLIPRLPSFLDRHPALTVRIQESHLPADFSDGAVHAAIRIEDGRPRPGVKALAFMDHSHGPVLSPERLAETGRDPDRLLALPRLHSETFRPAWEQWAATAGLALPPASLERSFEHNSYMLEAAAAGLGIAVAPFAFAQSDLERGRLVAPWGFAPVAARYVFLRPAAADNRAAEAFGAWLREEGRRAPRPPAPLLR
jgi:DNA-binding transcriptional LysR family regulator